MYVCMFEVAMTVAIRMTAGVFNKRVLNGQLRYLQLKIISMTIKSEKKQKKKLGNLIFR